MSRIGRLPVTLPAGVTLEVAGLQVSVKGPKGRLSQVLPNGVRVVLSAGQAVVERVSDDRTARSMHGLARTLVRNLVDGVASGFQRTLEINGVGYRVELKKRYLVFSLGYSHPIYFEIPEGVDARVESPTRLTVSGIDRQLIGATAAKIRSFRSPEPYKGKGIKYLDEVVRRKEGKSGAR